MSLIFDRSILKGFQLENEVFHIVLNDKIEHKNVFFYNVFLGGSLKRQIKVCQIGPLLPKRKIL